MGEHTDTPWGYEYIGDKPPGHFASDKATIGFVGDYRIICADEQLYDGHADDAQDAKFIVEAANSIEETVKALARHRSTISALVGKLTVARNMLEGYAKHDERIGHIEDAAFTARVVAEIDAALLASKEGSDV